jgi:hypothetical protein
MQRTILMSIAYDEQKTDSGVFFLLLTCLACSSIRAYDDHLSSKSLLFLVVSSHSFFVLPHRQLQVRID